MFHNLDRTTLRYLLEIAGYVALLAACVLHSWAWDGIGIGLLLAAHLMDPPSSVLGKVLASLGAFSLFAAQPVTKGVSPWELADRTYVQTIIREQEALQAGADPQYQFAFMDPESADAQSAYLQSDAFRKTPCGRTTHVRAWGDLH